MKLRKWWYDAKTTKWQIVFGVFIIFFLFVVPFSLLDQIEWDPDSYLLMEGLNYIIACNEEN